MRDERYAFTNGYTMRRERGYMWHLRNAVGELVTTDQYRNDIISRYRLKTKEHTGGILALDV